MDMTGETLVDETDIEVIDSPSKIEEPSDVSSFDDVLTAIDDRNNGRIVAGDEVFQEIYENAHDTNIPDQRVQTGQILTPVIRPSAKNIEQEISISIPVILPDGESVKMYTTLYGSDNPDEAIDRMIHQYTVGDAKISKLMGVHVPLIYIDGEWKLYLISQGTVIGTKVHSWLANHFRALISEKDIVEFGKDYSSPFEDDPKLIENGGATALESVNK